MNTSIYEEFKVKTLQLWSVIHYGFKKNKQKIMSNTLPFSQRESIPGSLDPWSGVTQQTQPNSVSVCV